jgi:hypothetical protein
MTLLITTVSAIDLTLQDIDSLLDELPAYHGSTAPANV